jgi:hypothetical protein
MLSWSVAAVVDFWRRPVRAEPLALFRIVFGVTYLAALLIGLAPELNRYLELCPPEALDGWLGATGRWSLFRAPAHFPERKPEETPFLSPEFARAWNDWGGRRENVQAMFALLVLAVVGLTLGLCTRTCSVAAWLLTISFHHRILWTINGGDDMFREGLFYLAVPGLLTAILNIGQGVPREPAPAAAVWSLDRRWARRRGDASRAAGPVFIAPWSVRLIQIQLCMVYFFTGLAKLGADWIHGEALYWVMNDLALARWPYFRLPVPMWLCRLASWGTISWEIGFPLLVACRWFRRGTLLVGVLLHLGILASMEVGWFSQVTLCWYAVFLPGDRLAAALARLSPGKGPAAATLASAEACAAAAP